MALFNFFFSGFLKIWLRFNLADFKKIKYKLRFNLANFGNKIKNQKEFVMCDASNYTECISFDVLDDDDDAMSER